MKQAAEDGSKAIESLDGIVTRIFPIEGCGLGSFARKGTEAMDGLTMKLTQISAITLLLESDADDNTKDTATMGGLWAIRTMAEECQALARAVLAQHRRERAGVRS